MVLKTSQKATKLVRPKFYKNTKPLLTKYMRMPCWGASISRSRRIVWKAICYGEMKRLRLARSSSTPRSPPMTGNDHSIQQIQTERNFSLQDITTSAPNGVEPCIRAIANMQQRQKKMEEQGNALVSEIKIVASALQSQQQSIVGLVEQQESRSNIAERELAGISRKSTSDQQELNMGRKRTVCQTRRNSRSR